MTITILCGLGEYSVELQDDLSIQDLPRLIEANGGIVVPFEDKGVPGKLFIPASQIQGITWAGVGVVGDITEEVDVPLAEVAYIEQDDSAETLVDPPVVGANGEVFIDA